MVGEGAAGGRRKEREGRGNRTGGKMEIEIEKGERRTAGEDGGGNERRRSQGVGEMEDGEGYAFNILRTLKLPLARFPFMTQPCFINIVDKLQRKTTTTTKTFPPVIYEIIQNANNWIVLTFIPPRRALVWMPKRVGGRVVLKQCAVFKQCVFLKQSGSSSSSVGRPQAESVIKQCQLSSSSFSRTQAMSCHHTDLS